MNYKYGVIAPSHMATDQLLLQKSDVLFEDVLIYSIHGLANWSQIIPVWIKSITENNLPAIWMVSDVFLNNKDIHKLQKMEEGKLFLPGARGQSGNIVHELRTIDNCIFLSNHTMKVIDNLISIFPEIKLCFWCLYMRTKCRSSDNVSDRSQLRSDATAVPEEYHRHRLVFAKSGYSIRALHQGRGGSSESDRLSSVTGDVCEGDWDRM